MSKLTPKRQRFVEEYLLDLNAAQAAIRAGYSRKTAKQQGQRLLTNVDVAVAVEKGMDERSERIGISADQVLAELASLALYDPADIASQVIKGPADIQKLPKKVRRAIIGWSWDRHGHFIPKLAPKTPNLELLGKHLKLFTERVMHDAELGLTLSPEQIDKVYDAARGIKAWQPGRVTGGGGR